MQSNPQEAVDLVTFTEEIINGKLHFQSSIQALFSLFRLTDLSKFTLILSSCRVILNIFRVFSTHLGSFRLILVFGSFRFIQNGLSSQTHQGSFRLIQIHLACLSSFESFYAKFHLESFQPIKYILEETTLIYILLICCKLLLQSSV